jgi:uncharacterized protein YcfL
MLIDFKNYCTLVICLTAIVSGCVSQNQLLANKQSMAINTAVHRGRFTTNCPSAAGSG